MARQFNGTTDFATSAIDLTAYSIISIALWYNALGTDGQSDACPFGYVGAANGRFYWNVRAGVSHNQMVFGMNAGAYETAVAALPSNSVWHQITAVYNRTAPSILAWLDGVLAGSKSSAASLGAFGNGTLNLGRYASDVQHMKCKLAGITIWGGVSLVIADAVHLSSGASPFEVHPDGIIFHAPLLGDSPEADYSGKRQSVTLSGTTLTPNPPVRPRMLGVVRESGVILRRGPYFSPAVAGQATVSGSVVRTRARSASVAARATVSASLGRIRARSASVSGTATVTSTLGRIRSRAASVSASAAVTATLVRQRARAAAVAGAATVTSTLVRTRARAANVAASASVSAAVVRTRTLSATVAASASASAALGRLRTFGASIAGAALVTASVTRMRHLAAAIAAGSTVAAILTRIRSRRAVAESAAIVTAELVRTRAFAATSSGTSTLDCRLGRIRAISAAISAEAGVSASVNRIRIFVLNAEGSSAVTCGLGRRRSIVAVVHGATLVTVRLSGRPNLTPAFTGRISLADVGELPFPGSSTAGPHSRIGRVIAARAGRLDDARPGRIA